MMCLGPIKSLLLLRCKLTAQGMADHTNVQSRVLYHSAIRVPFKIANHLLTPKGFGKSDGLNLVLNAYTHEVSKDINKKFEMTITNSKDNFDFQSDKFTIEPGTNVIKLFCPFPPGLFFISFRLYKKTLQFLQRINVKKWLSSIYQDANPQPSEFPITTRPGLKNVFVPQLVIPAEGINCVLAYTLYQSR